jgi:protoheme IX farnesyltransferase
MRSYFKLTKAGIVLFVVLSGIAGYWLSFDPFHQIFSVGHFLNFILGLYLVSSGSCALNQAQESDLDSRMNRTSTRPIPAGTLKSGVGYAISLALVVAGIWFLYQVSPLAALLGLVTIILYNFLYTIYWKPRWTFAAVPGAIPGAMPVVIGYSANTGNIFSAECVYVFLVMFLWQMPHFWALAIRFREDYQQGGIPVLPVQLGVGKTLFHMGLYTFTYVALAVASPWFVSVYFIYLVVVLPLAAKVLYEFMQYYKHDAKSRWLPFFLWTNLSVLVFLAAPVLDKWHLLLAHAR